MVSDLEVLEAGRQRLVECQVLGVHVHSVVAGDGEHLVHDVVLLLQGGQLRRHAAQEGQVVHELLHCAGEVVQAPGGTLWGGGEKRGKVFGLGSFVCVCNL